LHGESRTESEKAEPALGLVVAAFAAGIAGLAVAATAI
jgi:hypothetical protein